MRRSARRIVFMAADDESLPSSYDARTVIVLPEARDQGDYGTCWAFAALGAMEANYRKQNLTSLGEYPNFSELHLAWFTYKTLHSNDVKSAEYILNKGGSPAEAKSFLSMGTSPVSEEDMPYSRAGTIEAFLAGKTFTRTAIKLHDTNKIGSIELQNMDYVKRDIMRHGAIYFHYRTNDSGYDSTHNSFFYASAREAHAALLVGWDDDYPAANFKSTPSMNGAWLVRNSWGKDWGDNGYVFIVSEDIPDTTEEKKLHDEGGETVNITPKWSANIFKMITKDYVRSTKSYSKHT